MTKNIAGAAAKMWSQQQQRTHGVAHFLPAKLYINLVNGLKRAMK
jgi:hypothetical protein